MNESSFTTDSKKIETQEQEDNETVEKLKIKWKEVCKNYFKLLQKENNKERLIKEYNNDFNK